MSKRPYISLKTKLAAALCEMVRPDADGKMVPVIDRETAKQLTADQIISLFHFDHYPIAKWMEGPDEPWNLVPTPIMEHRVKTATYDTPNSAKADRVTEEQERSRQKMLSKIGQADEPQDKRFKWKRYGFRYDWKRKRYVKIEAGLGA